MIQNVQSVADADEWANGRRANGRAKALTHACALAARIRPRWRGIRKPTHRQKLSQNSRARSCPLMPAHARSCPLSIKLSQNSRARSCPLMPAHARSASQLLSISITQHLNYSASQLHLACSRVPASPHAAGLIWVRRRRRSEGVCWKKENGLNRLPF